MSRNLEKFTGDNRSEFDDAIPSDKVWQNIEAAFTQKKQQIFLNSVYFKCSVAAALLLMMGSGIYFFSNKNKPAESIAEKVTASDVNGLASDEAPQINAFAKIIAIKQEEMKMIAKEQPDLYKRFTTDITELDSSYTALKKQLNISPNREMLIEAMIQNLQLQLSVLNQQLNIINQIKQSKKHKHEKYTQSI